ncbi:MAG: retroviral-like aspartic protease family protein [Brevundimonas sp.]|uniref:retroviral-like aspartic protease family protein n=1 Tax=Brevundimonas sp. TaxID=1871086 RepID=UPI0025BAB4FD|nr:retroviral-like aspartic protease family protein [Brevundimonas sp.]MCH4269710.1 retroviral-like aspartic protease family protein [Brevundimonas sp.]
MCIASVPDRRALLTLVLATGVLGLARPLCAQNEPEAEARLLTNLLTRMAVEVELGRRRALFVIDTGAERTSISDRLAAELKLAAGPLVRVHGITGSVLAPTARLPQLSFSQRRFADLILPIFPYALLRTDGLLGLDALSRFRLTLDFHNRRVLLAPSYGPGSTSVFAEGRASRLPFVESLVQENLFQRLLISRVVADGVEAVAFIDTGAQYSIGNHALMRTLDARLGRVDRPQARVYGVTGQSLMAEVGQVSSLQLHQRDLGLTPLLFADLHAFHILGLIEPPALLLGADVLTRFDRVVLDYGARRIGFGSVTRRPPSSA